MVRASKDPTIFGFHGMNNLSAPPAPLVDRRGQATPHFCVNCDVMDSGVAKKATGYSLAQSLSKLHSLAGEETGLSVLLGVLDGVLTRFEPASGTSTPLVDVGPKSQMTYAEVNQKVYCASAYWRGVYNLITGAIESWGLPVPDVAPDVSFCAGDLPPGRDSICYVRVDAASTTMSGNGPIRQIEFQGQAQGLQLENLADDFLVYLTQVSGGPLFLAEVNGSDQITAPVPDFNPLRTFNVIPPPCFTHFAFTNGRFWGVSGRNLHHSEPSEYGDFGWFSRKVDTFLEELVMVAPYNAGVYVSSRTSTWNLKGTEPDKMVLERVGGGAIPGTLTLAQIPAKLAGGGVPTAEFGELSMMPTPVWRSPRGWVVGTHSGHLILVTERHLKVSGRQQGASLFRVQEGIPQIITSLWGVAQGEDEETQTIFQESALFALPVEISGISGLLLGSSI